MSAIEKGVEECIAVYLPIAVLRAAGQTMMPSEHLQNTRLQPACRGWALHHVHQKQCRCGSSWTRWSNMVYRSLYPKCSARTSPTSLLHPDWSAALQPRWRVDIAVHAHPTSVPQWLQNYNQNVKTCFGHQSSHRRYWLEWQTLYLLGSCHGRGTTSNQHSRRQEKLELDNLQQSTQAGMLCWPLRFWRKTRIHHDLAGKSCSSMPKSVRRVFVVGHLFWIFFGFLDAIQAGEHMAVNEKPTSESKDNNIYY